MTRRLVFNGIVQGIGFRPTAQRLALSLGITGQVKNSGGSVEVIISGNKEALDCFVQRLIDIFEIKNYTDKTAVSCEFDGFKIIHSSNDNQTPFITPDLATCKKCEKELLDKNNPRYHHPFISCTDCGPRYTIMDSLPYDRENTVMNEFEMCSFCKKEYTDSQNKRCHAQTIACNTCGPTTNISIEEAGRILNNGEILAIKDIGGYHLACKTEFANAVYKIRKLKGREKKPFAVMFSSINEIKQFCIVSKKEEELLLSPARPIVLLDKIKDFDKSVCGDSGTIGAFLPCNPIQILLLNICSPLVMTSANISGEPIITDDEEIKKFGVNILSHNRKILTPVDDSVLRVVRGKIQFIRRARGYVPLSIDIGVKTEKDTLCLGGDLKSVFAFHRDSYVFLSQQFGDLEDSKVFDSYKKNIKRFSALHSFKTEKIIADSHPGYFSSNIFKNSLTVQHHKAHVASVIAEHKLQGSVLGFAFDGTGCGEDGAVWGSEVFLFNEKSFERVEHLKYTKMLAGDEISKNARLALECYLGGNPIADKAIEADINTVNSSSMGRLFDAVCSLLDIKHYNNYEGECACALEQAAKKSANPCNFTPSLNPIEILNQIKNSNASKEDKAMGFHLMLCHLILDIALKYNIKQIVLSGGVFNNKIITENTIKLLEENNFKVYINEQIPCGDGGIALGQAYIASLEE